MNPENKIFISQLIKKWFKKIADKLRIKFKSFWEYNSVWYLYHSAIEANKIVFPAKAVSFASRRIHHKLNDKLNM